MDRGNLKKAILRYRVYSISWQGSQGVGISDGWYFASLVESLEKDDSGIKFDFSPFLLGSQGPYSIRWHSPQSGWVFPPLEASH